MSGGTPDTSLELSGAQLRQLVELAMQHLSAYLDNLPGQPAWNFEGVGELARSVSEPLAEQGQPAEALLDDLFQRLVPLGYNSASPGYLAYVPGGGLPHAAVADLIAGVINRYVGMAIAAPALAQLEANVVRWFCDIVGYPPQAGGFLTTGGSLANWSALVTARRCRLPDQFLSGTLYTSDQAHHSIGKAALLAGFPPQNVRRIEVDSQFRIRLDRLAERIARDRRQGWTPFAVVGQAGTTNTGAVDDLGGLADLAARENLWLHVDAAYGGFFLLTERGRQRMQGIHRADSITLDPHKGLFLPYGTGCLLARDREHMRQAHSLAADYLSAEPLEGDLVDFHQISPELSRDFRGLRVWLPLKMHGLAPFRNNLDEKLDLATWATAQVRRLNDELAQLRPTKEEMADELEVMAEPQLSVVAFRLRRRHHDEQALTRLNQQLLERINASRRVLLTGTTVHGRYVIRICVLSFRTHQAQLEQCFQEIRRALS